MCVFFRQIPNANEVIGRCIGGFAEKQKFSTCQKKLISRQKLFFVCVAGDGETLAAGVGAANHGLLDEEGHETAIGSSSDPERSSLSGGQRDCDSELEDEERERGGVGGGGESAHHDESGSSPSASSLFIKRTVDEVTIRWIRFTIVKYTCDLNQAVNQSKGDQSNWVQRISCSCDNCDKNFER